MYIRVGSVLRRKRLLTLFYPQLPSIFASEICRENRRLQNALKKLRRRVDRTRNEISNQPEIARMILDEFLKEKSEVCVGHQNNLLKNRQLVEVFLRLKIEQTDLGMVTERLRNIENQSRRQDNTVEENLDAIFKEKSGDIRRGNAVIVSRFYSAAFIVLTSYTSLCGLSFVCGGQKLFEVLVGAATTTLILSCVKALRQVIKNGKKLQQVEHAQSRLPAEFFSGHLIPVEPSTRQDLRLVWRDMLQILVISILAAVYLVFLAVYMLK